jgi:epidermal growth factor receptor substrate 15
MYLIQTSESGRLPLIPAAVPAEIHEQIAGAMSKATAPESRIIKSKSLVIDPSVVSRSFPSRRKSLPQLPRPLIEDVSRTWDVTHTEKLDADHQFDILDPQKNGFVEGEVAAKYMLRFRLQPEDLAHIWSVKVVFDNGIL